eukprot:g12297.t1
MAPTATSKSVQMSRFKAGDPIWVYNREERDESSRHHVAYIAVQDHRHGNFRPRVGLSEGWVPAIVSQDFHPERFSEKAEESWVQFEFAWPHWFNCRGSYIEKEKLFYHSLPKFCVGREVAGDDEVHLEPAGGGGGVGRARPTPRRTPVFPYRGDHFDPSYQPELSIVAFRWGGSDIPDSDPGELLGITNRYLYRLTDFGLRPILDTNYEIWSVYVEDKNDCETLAKSLHLVFGENHPVRRAKRVCAMFFLQPTGFDTKSQPALMTGDENGAGSIEYDYLYKLMRSTERCGLPTRFPHCAHLYQQLTNKEWTHMLCLNPAYKIPASIAVPRMWLERDIAATAAKARKMLQCVRDKQTKLGMVPARAITSGVAKLGYSWEALDVKLWREDNVKPSASTSQHRYGLDDALLDLTRQIEITDNLVGQAHYLDHVIVQEFIPHVCEMRLYFVENVCEFCMFTKFDRVKSNNEFGDFNYLSRNELLFGRSGEGNSKDPNFAGTSAGGQKNKAGNSRAKGGTATTTTADSFNGDEEALDKAIEMGKQAALELMDWIRMQTLENVVPAIRFDFFLQYEAPGQWGAPGSSAAPSSGTSAAYKVLGGASSSTTSTLNSSSTDSKSKTAQPYSNQWVSPRGSRVTVHTLEICELGFSTLHNKEIPKRVMPAIVRSCLRMDQVE